LEDKKHSIYLFGILVEYLQPLLIECGALIEYGGCIGYILGWFLYIVCYIPLFVINFIGKFILRDIENMCDWIVPIVYMLLIHPNINEDGSIQNTDTFKWSVMCCIILQAVRVSLAIFSLFESTRHFSILLKKVATDMIPFLAIFYTAIGFFAFFLAVTCKFDKGCEIEPYFSKALRVSFELSLVDNNFNHKSSELYLVYMIGSLLMVIMLLNILIAVISDTFD